MLAFLKANYLTILIILVLVAIVVGIICSIVTVSYTHLTLPTIA